LFSQKDLAVQTTDLTERTSRGCDKQWFACALLYLLASAPLSARAADAAIEQKAQLCVACHGADGQSSNPTLPSLAGQTSRYMYEELSDFQAGRRHSVTMTPIAKTLSAGDMQALADFFSAQRPMSSSYAAEPAMVTQGASIAANALCTTCHGENFAGQNETPRVAGQQYAYIVKQLESFRDGRRTNDGGSMQGVVHGVSNEQIEAIAQYVANLD
jgi:cytochrome c553